MAAPDASALARMMARPGMDPRVWLTLAIVTRVVFDEEHGIFCDIQFQPGGEPETALLGAAYAGSGFGLYCPVQVDDIVLVAVPMGDPGNGPVIISRMWSAADRPSADFGSGETPSDDVVLRVRPGKKLRILTSESGDGVEITTEGNGDIVIQATGEGKVYIGGKDGSEPIALGTTLKNHLDQVKQFLELVKTHTHPVSGTVANASAELMVGPPSVPDIEADEGNVK